MTAARSGYATGVAVSEVSDPVAAARPRMRLRVQPRAVRSGATVQVRARVLARGITPRGRVEVFYRGERVRRVRLDDEGRITTSVATAGRGRQVVRVVYRGAPGMRRVAERARIQIR
ncbi:hypothetical protein [Nocardioides sp.]|uniref:hypothetical protein n=1 Tax=Nocardioides sp. TaxID=35761 RepID=UPI002736C300|nr:hypothetical protein [Nocardioides sp.]MDP3889822.1 hypothetical protein [Nocardioides sp.]